MRTPFVNLVAFLQEFDSHFYSEVSISGVSLVEEFREEVMRADRDCVGGYCGRAEGLRLPHILRDITFHGAADVDHPLVMEKVRRCPARTPSVRPYPRRVIIAKAGVFLLVSLTYAAVAAEFYRVWSSHDYFSFLRFGHHSGDVLV